jgi:hypothetical protein
MAYRIPMKTTLAPRPLRYHLRFQILPGPNAAPHARELAAFCKAHRVEEVALFITAEEWNNGLLSRADENRWMRTVQEAGDLLKKNGIAVSLNPWMTSLHCARGRTFQADHRFIPMVSPTGEVSKACASFADPAFQDYLARLYGRFARLGFRVIWIEDDFRFHNHGPLTWGGGFEQPVLDRFSRLLGKKATREEVATALLKPGKPHPWRALWQTVWRDIHLDVAGKLAAAVSAASGGKTALGLMSSSPATHSLEGRDWTALFNALSIGGKVAHRPHFAPYAEAPGWTKAYSSQMLDLQKNFRPAGCEVAPEIENFPFTRWTKSDIQTWSEMALCQIHGSDALLLDLFPFSGNRASSEPQIGELLDRARPGLAWLAAQFPAGLQTQGVGVPYKTDAGRLTRLPKGASSLWQFGATSPFEAGQYLMQYGIPVTSRIRPVNAVFGPLAWAFTDAELERMLEGGLLLDAASAAILLERGFGALIGLKGLEMVGREEDSYAIEETIHPAAGVPAGFYMNANLGATLARLQPARGAESWTRILRPDGTAFGPGWITFRNRLGGRVALCSSTNPAQLPACYQRQVIAQNLVRFLAKGRFGSPMVTGGAHQLLIHVGEGRGQKVVVMNGMTDASAPILQWTGRKPDLTWWTLPPLARPVRAAKNASLPYLGIFVGTADAG